MRATLYNELYNKAKAAVSEYADSRTFPLVYHLYSKGYSYRDVAKILGVSKQAVMKKYPKKETK